MNVSFQSLGFTLFLSLYLLFPIVSVGQEISGNESLAIEYFKDANYEKALPIFTKLVNKSPGNAMYNYYYGVCLLKNNQFDTATKEALLNAVVDKTPSNSNFYLANYFHALENWSEAMDFYKRYKGSNQEKRALSYEKFVDMCSKHINPFTVSKGDAKNIFVDTLKAPPAQPDEKTFPIPDSLRTEWFNFQINSQLIYHGISDFKSEAAKILFAKAWIATGKNDSIVRNTDVLRKAHEETHNVTTRIALVQRIVDAEQQSYQLLRDREKYFEQARVKEAGYWEKAGADSMANFIKEVADRESIRNERILNEKKKTEAVTAPEVVEMPADQLKIEDTEPEKLPIAPEAQPVGNDNIAFKVQIGSFLNGKLTPGFKTLYARLSKFRKIDKYTDTKKFVVYTVGNFTEYKDATMLKNQLILEGVKGAFLAAYKNGERISIAKVMKTPPSK